MSETQFIFKSRTNMVIVFGVPDTPSKVCGIRLNLCRTNPNIKIVTIGLHGGKAITNWVGVYGIITPETTKCINPYDLFLFGIDEDLPHYKIDHYSNKLHNFKYVNEDI